MNEQLQKELAAWLAQLRDAAQHGTNFALDQAPLIVQEKIAFGRFVETFELLIGASLLVTAYWFSTKASYWDEQHDHPFGYIGACVFGFVGLFVVCVQITYVAEAWIAPRLYVIDWLAGLLK